MCSSLLLTLTYFSPLLFIQLRFAVTYLTPPRHAFDGFTSNWRAIFSDITFSDAPESTMI